MKTDGAVRQIIELEDEANKNTGIHRIHPLAKLLVTVAFLGLCISFDRFDVSGVIMMGIFPIVIFTWGMFSFSHFVRRIWPVIILLLVFGVSNIFVYRNIAIHIGNLGISYGVLSMVVLLFKGIWTVMVAYLLIATTGIENICYALRLIRVPKVIVTLILLTYRYLGLLINQAGELFTAYRLRAPGQRGISISAWGPLLGQLLIRTIDRAETLYDSMTVRGYDGNFPFNDRGRKTSFVVDIIYVIASILVIVALRFLPIAEYVGKLL